ncbi:MFS transporter [Microbacterium jiangjiandongii]|uniref:MFS transporter n=1 Tax=Microbacterium jiangjiandongii TaxID=3049071 RepID=UPI00214C5484|nr:MFS transporter [Microbacterium sp. zg.Y843]MCR2816887.1 MFS transporter [Microbacterium sp. zg.Y843]
MSESTGDLTGSREQQPELRGGAGTVRAGERWPSRSFRWLWAASATSLLGSEIGELALPLLALLTLDASAGELAVVRVAQYAPFLVLTLALGVMVDRMRRKRLLIAADLARGVVLTAIVIAALALPLPIWMLAVAVFVIGTCTVLAQLADFSLLPAVVPNDRLTDANARLTSTQSAMSIAGSGVGGVIVQTLTAPIALAANAATYLFSALFLTRVTAVERARNEAVDRVSPWLEARAGLAFLRRNRVVRDLALEAATWNFASEILLLGLTLHVTQQYDLGPAILGGLLMTSGAGAVLGALVSARATRRFGYGRSLIAASIVGNSAPLALIFTAAAPSAAALAVAGVALALSGFGVGLAGAQAVTVRQLATPDDIRGRVNAAYRFLSWGMIAIGAIAAGFVATAGGPAVAIVVGAVGTTLATGWILWSPVRKLRGLDDAVEAR